MLTFKDNLFSFGGCKHGYQNQLCYVFHMKSFEVRQIMSLFKRTWDHTLHHIYGQFKAYICGGKMTDYKRLKDCLVFDILNQKLKTFG